MRGAAEEESGTDSEYDGGLTICLTSVLPFSLSFPPTIFLVLTGCAFTNKANTITNTTTASATTPTTTVYSIATIRKQMSCLKKSCLGKYSSGAVFLLSSLCIDDKTWIHTNHDSSIGKLTNSV